MDRLHIQIGLNGGLNLYSYAHNPIVWTDPLGLTPCKGLPSTRRAGGTGKHYDPINGQGLYVLHDGKNIIYVGRGDAPARLNSHANTPGKSHLEQLTIFDNNLTKAEAKFLEQRIMDLNGGAKSTNSLTNPSIKSGHIALITQTLANMILQVIVVVGVGKYWKMRYQF